ncbi:MAG: hypothetical protein ABI177_08110 [Edaphobacter sp.]
MTTFRNIARLVTAIMIIAVTSISLNAQAASPTNQSASIVISITLEKSTVTVGQKPLAILIVKNVTNHNVMVSTDVASYRVHVESEKNNPPKTEFHRHLHGDFRSGDGPSLASGPVVPSEIAPGAALIQKFDLTAFYDLSESGKYAVYIEARDQSGIWLHSNTVELEMIPPTQ